MPTPFGAEFSEERTVQGYTVPTKYRAGWHYGTEQWSEGEFYRAELKDVRFIS